MTPADTKVVPISGRPRRRRVATPGDGPLRRRLAELEREVSAAHAAQEHEGLLVTAARVLEAGAKGLSWKSLARLQRALYFAWHSEETDEFGADPRFAQGA
jgi:predicted nucleic acid-binding Zn ribbon protein